MKKHEKQRIIIKQTINDFNTKDLFHLHDLIISWGKMHLNAENESFNKEGMRISGITDYFNLI